MIKTNDLRRGNYVSVNNETIVFCKVDRIFKQQCQVENIDPLISEEGLEPIPLTPEILEAAGFGKSDFIEVYSRITGKQEVEKGYITYEKPFDNRTIKIEYVHQLQNIYYYLSGEELTINLNQLQQA